MLSNNPNLESIFLINSEETFNRQALINFQYQFEHLNVYRKFCQYLGKTNPQSYKEIPFLPISFFKTHQLVSDEVKDIENLLLFKSSGTTHQDRSKHFIAYPKLYEQSFLATFSQQMIAPKDAIIFALLPNYLEQGNSSLIYMVDRLIQLSNSNLSGFYLQNQSDLLSKIELAKKTQKKVVLFGVSYALLDFAEKGVDLSGVMVVETGGMKGRRKEIIKEELHNILKKGLNVKAIYSEYGMTELLSQAYSDGKELFTAPPWMRILIRDINDPNYRIGNNKTGGINVIDLANFYSCSFIATDDLGQTIGNGFKILGRFDQSELRGCNLLVQ